ncbi:methyl-accepting chemotaxis protein [Actinoplanes sp. NPDC049118]|uniref:methyl-accepting chemotaxis protein n=1 Tax=Actinoplanes sp. NPDC049118 TaxID=3155769 RepID=UPI0033D964FB
MARLWGSKPAAGGVPPMLQSADTLLAALDNAPAVLLITDAAGDIVYRNKAGDRMARESLANLGEQALLTLRDTLKHIIATATEFPVTRSVPTEVNGRALHGGSTVDRIPGGYICTWVDETAQVETTEVVNSMAVELTRASAGLADAGQELAAAAGRSAEQADALSQGSGEMAASIREIASRVSNATSSTDTAVESARNTAGSMEQLQKSSTEIGNITKLITAVAEQTKLLALNAQIESARAGAAGKGFAVVAGEVKELAGRSADATQQIIQMIEAIQAESQQAAGGISGIVGLIENVAEQQTMIAASVEEQTATSAEMSGGMRAVAESVSAAASAAETVLAAAASLRDQADRLRQLTA